jgi:sugar phosphate isomerase/epimerase
LLEQVKHRVVTMHASDRHLKPGHTVEELQMMENSPGYASILTHGVIGQGINDYPRIFRTLREVGFNGWVSIEDGLNDLGEIRTSAEYLRPLMDRYTPPSPRGFR